MNANQQADFRAATERRKLFNQAQKTCKGPCKQRRSVGQFAAGDDVCAQCRRRGTK